MQRHAPDKQQQQQQHPLWLFQVSADAEAGKSKSASGLACCARAREFPIQAHLLHALLDPIHHLSPFFCSFSLAGASSFTKREGCCEDEDEDDSRQCYNPHLDHILSPPRDAERSVFACIRRDALIPSTLLLPPRCLLRLHISCGTARGGGGELCPGIPPPPPPPLSRAHEWTIPNLCGYLAAALLFLVYISTFFHAGFNFKYFPLIYHIPTPWHFKRTC